MNPARHLPTLLLGLTATALVLLQAAIGGARLVYALPAFILLAVAGVAAVALFRTEVVIPRTYCLASAVALAGYVIVRALLSPVEMLARPDFFTALAALVIYLLGAFYLSGVSARFTVMLVLMLFAVLQVGVSIWQFKDQANFMPLPWIFRPDYGFKASGFFISPNHLATLFGMLGVICLSVSCWGRIGLSARAFAFYGFIVCLTGAVLTGSRGGFYSIGAGLIVLVLASIILAQLFNRPHFFGLAIATALIITIVVGVVLRMVVASEVYETRLRHVRDPSGKSQMLFPVALAQHRLNPVSGTGAGTFLYYSRQFRSPAMQSDPQHAHNDALELLAEYGWLGLGLASAFLFTHLVAGLVGIRNILDQKQRATFTAANSELALILGASAALIVALVHSLGDFTFHLPALALFAAFLFSILANPAVDLASRRRRRVPPWWLGGLLPAAALLLLGAAVSRWPGELLAERSRLALRDGDEPRALDLARRAVARDPANADAHYQMGEALHYLALEAGDPTRAEELRQQAAAAFTTGLQHFPQDVRLLLKLGRTLDDLAQPAAADPIFARALAAAPTSGIVQASVGLHWHRRGDLAQAGSYYRSALALGELPLATAGLSDLERDQAVVRANQPFADLLPDASIDPGTPLPAK